MHRPRKSDPPDLDDAINPSDHFDPTAGIGKDPDLSGPREDESAVESGDEAERDNEPRHRKES